MQIKPITHKQFNKLLKLKINKNFKENFELFLPRRISHEVTFVALQEQEIIGAFSYKSHGVPYIIDIDNKKHHYKREIKFLEFIEIKPTARNKGVATALLHHAFEICAATQSGLKVSNIVMEGSYLLNKYKQLSDQYKVDLFFSQADYAPQVFHSTPIIPIEKPSIFKRLFKF